MNSLSDTFFERSINLDQYIKTVFHYNKYDLNKLCVIPEEKDCIFCSKNLKMIKRKATGFILLNIIAKCDVYVGLCENEECNAFEKPVSFNGTLDGFINYSNKFFIGVELIVEYMNLYAQNGVSFSAWIKSKMFINNAVQESDLYSNSIRLNSYHGVLHEAFCSGTDLFMFPQSAFYCCESPEVLQMDGLVSSVKSSRMVEFYEPWVQNKIVQRASKRNERQLDKLDENTSKQIKEILHTNKCSLSTIQNLQQSSYVGVRAFSYCFEKQEEDFILRDLAKFFGMTLIKLVAAANSLIPKSCILIVERYIIIVLFLYKLEQFLNKTF